MADEEVPVFRKIKKKAISIRKVATDEDPAQDDDVSTKIGDIKEVQKSRSRRHGLNAVECAVGKELAKEFELLDENPFQMRGGGMLKLSADQKAALSAVEMENDIKDQFKKETLLRDEHEEMKKYVDQRLNNGSETNGETSEPDAKKFKPQSLQDEILFQAAEKIKQFSSKSNDELLSNQMLVGIPEVDLGLKTRMNNILETEQKKQEFLKNKKLPNKNEIQRVNPDDPAIKKLRR